LVVREDENLGVMVNEEDHLRLQAMRPGLMLNELWREIDALDSEIEAKVRYSFSAELGYLTACPTNVGTGLRASAMLHVPALRLANEIEPIIKGLAKIGLVVRGLLGEGTEATGNMFQVSNQTTLGESEETIIERLTHIVSEVAEHERNARMRLMEGRGSRIRDFIGRAYGVLCHAQVLTSRETLDLLSGLRLGVDLGIVSGLEISELNRLTLTSQPGHMQKLEGQFVEPGARDELRAARIRGVIRRATISG
jgi:protein arginine kinase